MTIMTNIPMGNDILQEIDLLDQSLDHQEEILIIEKAKQRLADQEKDRLEFPVDAFPTRIQNVINVFNACYQLPKDYFGLGILTAASTVIGNNYKIEYKYKQSYAPIVYSAVVGNPGMGKTPAINICLSPIFKIEEEFRKKHKEKVEQWKQECFDNSMQPSKQKDPPKPRQKEIIINDATTEAINHSLSNSPHGLLYYRDELAAWINSMNQYRSGSDNEFWLSNWSNVSSKINRSGKDPMFIKDPFVNVIGGIQPGILQKLTNDGKGDNGFFARILFAYPDSMRKPYESDQYPDQSVFDLYHRIIRNLNNLPSLIREPQSEFEEWTIESINLQIEDTAKAYYRKWLRANTDMINETEDDAVKAIYVKMENYCLRFALIIDLLGYAEDKELVGLEDIQQHQVGMAAIKGAIQLVDYFKRTSYKVISRLESPVNTLSPNKKAFYTELPESFTRKTAVGVGNALGLGESTVKRFLNETKFFKKLSRGTYEKKFI